MRIFFVILFCLFVPNVAFARLDQVVYLKNGSAIKCNIIEMSPGENIKIQTWDGSKYVYSMDEVEKVEQRDKDDKPEQVSEKGWRFSLDVTNTIGVGAMSNIGGEYRLEFNVIGGYQFNPYFYTGVGVGLHIWIAEGCVGVPIFADFRGNFLNRKATPYIDFRIGGDVTNVGGFYMSPTAGCHFRIKNNTGIDFGLGYTMQIAETIYWFFNSYSGFSTFYENDNYGGLSIRLAFDW